MSKAPANKKKQQPKKPRAPKTAVRRIAESVGGTLGGLVGLKDLGRDAGSWLARVTGLGDYTLNQNSFMKSSAGVPTFEYNADGSVVITHREYVRDIIGSTAFASTSWDICPNNPLLFEWLHTIALAYEQYEFLGLLACYVPSSGDAVSSTNNALGTVIMATEYDVSRPMFASKSEMEQSTFVTSEKPSEHQIHPIECNPNRDVVNARYMDSYFRTQAGILSSAAATSTTSDVSRNLRCTGRLQLSTVGMQAVTTVGELWLAYKVKFSKPRGTPPGLTGGFFHATNGSIPVGPADQVFTNAIVLSDSTMQANGIGITTPTTLSFAGLRPHTLVTIIYDVRYISGSSATYAFGIGAYASATVVPDFFGNGTNTGGLDIFAIDNAVIANTTRCTYQVTLKIADNADQTPAYFTIAQPTMGGTSPLYQWDLKVFMRPAVENLTFPKVLTSSIEERLEMAVRDIRSVANPPDESFVRIDEVDHKHGH